MGIDIYPSLASNLSADEIRTALGIDASGGATKILAQAADQSISARDLVDADLPATLLSRVVGGIRVGTNAGAVHEIYPSAEYSSSYLEVLGGPNAGYSKIRLHPGSHSTKAGIVEYYAGSAAGAKHSFFDKNGAEQLRVDENAVFFNTLRSLSGALILSANAGTGYAVIRSSDTASTAAALYLYNDSNSTYPGAHQQFAPLSTRAASTAFAVCPVATGDACLVLLMSDGGDAYAEVLISASATFSLLRGNGAYWVNSSSPAAGEVGIYVSASVLYCKPGSSFTGKIATFSKVGKA